MAEREYEDRAHVQRWRPDVREIPRYRRGGPEAIEAVHRHAGGIPQITNLLCEHALITAFVGHCKTISAKMVEEVARDFDLQEVDGEAAPKVGNVGGHPVLVDHPLPQNVKPSSIPLTKAAGEKKS